MSMVSSIKAEAGEDQHLRTGRQLLSMRRRLLKTALLLTILHYASAFDIFAMVEVISGITKADLIRYMSIADDAVKKDLQVGAKKSGKYPDVFYMPGYSEDVPKTSLNMFGDKVDVRKTSSYVPGDSEGVPKKVA
ncbi:unnamed protein product [Heligmosomoides polygyrus]|uniref:COesterase domain-containing protein n=1 Tax=Heligmosomoides polygyrus TaxID=6339 RepID=A0A183GDK5_HELPZ|nr:unnamed protein product [Heligmosomoides polygyrus]